MRSPLLDLPGAVAGEGIDGDVAAHYGSLYGEQRVLASGEGFVDLSHRDVFRVSGPDRLTWLHSLTTQYFEGLEPGRWVDALILSPQGHVEHAFAGVDDGEAFTAHTEPGAAEALIGYLDRMRFMMRVEVTDVTAEVAVAWRPRPEGGRVAAEEGARQAGRVAAEERAPQAGRVAAEEGSREAGRVAAEERGGVSRPGRYDLVPRERLQAYAEAAGPPAGLWAFEALRIARGEPRFGIDTDHRTIPNEVGWIDTAVHMDKGCYRGQETVARVHNLGRPPRRLTLLHLDGSENRLPEVGAPVVEAKAGRVAAEEGAPQAGRVAAEEGAPQAGRVAAEEGALEGGRVAAEERGGVSRPVGRVGSSARHHELGPIALALLKRNLPTDAQLEVSGLPAAQEVVVDPEVGLHFRPGR